MRHAVILRVVAAFAVAALLSACGGGSTLNTTIRRSDAAAHILRYTILDLGTLGGTLSFAHNPSNGADVAGDSTISGDSATRGFIWKNGRMTDLGTLGGPDSDTGSYRPLSDNDLVAGQSEIPTPDPNGEDACGHGTALECRAFLWKDGVMAMLPTLGASSGLFIAEANGINDRGQVSGTAVDIARGAPHAYLATPISGTGLEASTLSTKIAVPKSVEEALHRLARRHRSAFRY